MGNAAPDYGNGISSRDKYVPPLLFSLSLSLYWINSRKENFSTPLHFLPSLLLRRNVLLIDPVFELSWEAEL